MVVLQSGGPTAVMNASLVGAVREAHSARKDVRVFGARAGFEGLRSADYVDLTAIASSELDLLGRTPGAGLGSSRYRPTEQDLAQLVGRLHQEDVRWVLAIGGNDTADTLHRLYRAVGGAIGVVGVAKTIDNDLPGMDHTPGYGSAARYVATATREAAIDAAAMRRDDPIRILEVMGRTSGWLAAAAALAREEPADPPQVIFLPERPRPLPQMVREIGTAVDRHGFAVAVICENQTDESGHPIAGSEPVHTDPHGHPYYASAAAHLAGVVQAELGARARDLRPGGLQRTSIAAISAVDAQEAFEAGAEAARRALAGASDAMVAIQRRPGPEYAVDYTTVPLATVAGQARRLPDEFIAASGIDVTDAFLAYARPLIGGALPPIARVGW